MENIKNLEINYDMLSDIKKHDLYLRGLATGDIQGPLTGKASIDKPWLKYYSENDIILDVPKMKAIDYLIQSNLDNLDGVALNYFGKKTTYKKMFSKIDETAKSLKQMGIKAGDIVTVAMANTPELIYLFYALNKIGAISNAIDPRLTVDDIENEIKKVKSDYIFALDMCCPNVEKAIENTDVKKVVFVSALDSLILPVRIMANIKEMGNNDFKNNNKFISWKKFLKNGKNYTGEYNFQYINDIPVTLVRTGGTTGEPKGVMLTNENFVSMAHMHKNGGLVYDKDDTFLNILPPFIAYCLCNGVNMPLTLGLELTLVPKFELSEFPNLLKKYKPNHVLSGPILWEYVMKSDINDLSFLRTPVSGGDVLPIELERRINAFFESKNCAHKVAQGYGMTEVSSAAVFSLEESNKEGYVGIPFIKNIVSVFDPETLEEKLYGEEGEIWISTPTEMLGYYNNEEASAKLRVITKDGRKWIRTGDLGIISSDGNVKIVGRMKRMIVRSGNKIFPSVIENLVLEDSNIDMCGIVGKFDQNERHVPVIHIILNENASKSKNEIISSIKDRIKEKFPEFNVPVQFIFRNEMPLTSIKKIDFKLLELEEHDGEVIDITENKIKVK